MSTIKSNRATQAAMNEFAIEELTKELQAANDLIEFYKVALVEENLAVRSAKLMVRAQVPFAVTALQNGDIATAEGILKYLYNASI